MNIFFNSDFYRQADQLHQELSQLYFKYPTLNPKKRFGAYDAFKAFILATGEATQATNELGKALAAFGKAAT